tara:strand:- start:1048 stop:1377 length:330 start_codon:yes stop_codon:yes gene_type:complete
MESKFNKLVESSMSESVFNVFKPKVKKTLKNGEKLPVRSDLSMEWYAEPERDGAGIYIKSSGKFYKMTWLPGDDNSEWLSAVNGWMDSKGKDMLSLVINYLNKEYKLDL